MDPKWIEMELKVAPKEAKDHKEAKGTRYILTNSR